MSARNVPLAAEIALHICELLMRPDDITKALEEQVDESDRQSLARLAQVCKAFSPLALQVLWKELPRFAPVVELLSCSKRACNGPDDYFCGKNGRKERRKTCVSVSLFNCGRHRTLLFFRSARGLVIYCVIPSRCLKGVALGLLATGFVVHAYMRLHLVFERSNSAGQMETLSVLRRISASM